MPHVPFLGVEDRWVALAWDEEPPEGWRMRKVSKYIYVFPFVGVEDRADYVVVKADRGDLDFCQVAYMAARELVHENPEADPAVEWRYWYNYLIARGGDVVWVKSVDRLLQDRADPLPEFPEYVGER